MGRIGFTVCIVVRIIAQVRFSIPVHGSYGRIICGCDYWVSQRTWTTYGVRLRCNRAQQGQGNNSADFLFLYVSCATCYDGLRLDGGRGHSHMTSALRESRGVIFLSKEQAVLIEVTRNVEVGGGSILRTSFVNGPFEILRILA